MKFQDFTKLAPKLLEDRTNSDQILFIVINENKFSISFFLLFFLIRIKSQENLSLVCDQLKDKGFHVLNVV